ncbi:alpha/beta-hydrolase [Pholiota conissans]|uniref:Alpha/beta-hydrolase n=1 Tax=Pholiota conissans TaxID=109636 RepID=A0A9P5YNR8_9AGAR|nr:alpha/beta-hydrolase [Pholiota conissans]
MAWKRSASERGGLDDASSSYTFIPPRHLYTPSPSPAVSVRSSRMAVPVMTRSCDHREDGASLAPSPSLSPLLSPSRRHWPHLHIPSHRRSRRVDPGGLVQVCVDESVWMGGRGQDGGGGTACVARTTKEDVSLVLLASTAYGAPTVTIGRTTVVGTEFYPARVEFFGGIPFAQPPVGQLRLALPVLTMTINTPRFDASKFGLACLQTALPAGQVSEDCLNLNIFRPAGTKQTADLPVMVWIYGGNFVMGASSLYNGTEIVARSVARGTPVIFASINYRLGPLGFPQGIEAGQRNITNLGLRDQLVALEWIQANIARFGGDRSKVCYSDHSGCDA